MKFVLKFLNRRPVLFALVFWVFAVLVILVAANWLAMPIIAGSFTETMPVPYMINLSAKEAEELLQKAGLNFRWAKEGRYSNDIAANKVLIQMPIAGRTVKKNRTIFLTVSKGTHEVELPNLRGSSQRQAEISLQRLKLLLGEKIEGAHSEIPRGVVIRTMPEAGKYVREGTKIDIVISSGNSSGKTLLPNLRGLSLNRAIAIIDSLGFKLGEVATIQIEDKLPNTVLELNPKPGEYLEKETAISLTVAE
jgi:serine/threonine-protein kinase